MLFITEKIVLVKNKNKKQMVSTISIQKEIENNPDKIKVGQKIK